MLSKSAIFCSAILFATNPAIAATADATAPAVTSHKNPATGKKKPSVATPLPEVDPAVTAALAGLESANPEEVIISVQTLAIAGSLESAVPLEKLLKTRPRNDITDMVIGALGALGNPVVIDTLIEYLNHRRPDARLAAVFALDSFQDARLAEKFERLLSDSNANVRAAAATSLGKRGTEATVPLLFQAFDRGVREAMISIGKLGGPDDAKRATSYLGRVPIHRLLPGFREFLNRNDLPPETRLMILDALFELAGPEVYRFAASFKSTFPADADETTDPIYRKVNQMLRQISEK